MKYFYVSWMSALAVFPFLVVLSSDRAQAQEIDLFSDDVQVRLINIETVVTDKNGTPITGLHRDDFELRLDGKPISISHFSEMGSRSVKPRKIASQEPSAQDQKPSSQELSTPAATSNPISALSSTPADQRLNLVLYLDRSYTGPGDLEDLGSALDQFLDQNLRAGDRVMLISVDRQVEVLQKLTTRVSTIDPLLRQELTKQGRGLRIVSEYRDILREIGRTLETGTESQARHPEHHTQNLLARINGFSEEAYRDLELTGQQLQQVVAALSGTPGNNVVLYIGGRLPVNAGQTLFSAWQSAFGRNSTRWQMRGQQGGGAAEGLGAGGAGGGGTGGAGGGGTGNVNLSSDGVHFESMAAPDTHLDAAQLFANAGQLAASLGVRFYTLDASGQRSAAATRLSAGNQALATNSGGSQWEYGRTQRIQSQSALGELAETTGGRSLGESRDFQSLLTAMREDLEVTYSLGFAATDVEEGGSHEIEVRLTRQAKKKLRSPRIRHRQFVRNRTADQEAAETTLSALLTGSTANPMAVEIVVIGEIEDTKLPLLIKVPLTHLALVPETRVHTGRLTLFVTSGDLEQGAAPVRRAIVPLRIANDEIMNVVGHHLEYSLKADIQPGSRKVAVGVRDDFASLFSTVVLTLGASSMPSAPTPAASTPAAGSR